MSKQTILFLLMGAILLVSSIQQLRPSVMAPTLEVVEQVPADLSLSLDSVVCKEDRCVIVEIADTPALRQQGLMFRKELSDDMGMRFVFERSGKYPFWMKNTLIPLDMLRVDEQMRVVEIVTAQPCTADPCPSYGGTEFARYVLEINAGRAKQL
jgi:uncharacterized membrane protein (UPF0127 family)